MQRTSVVVLLVALVLAAFPFSVRGATYLPGVAPHDFSYGERVELYVDKITSTRTQIPYDYYSLPYCHPKVLTSSENLGEILQGDRIKTSDYELAFRVPQACRVLCTRDLSAQEVGMFANAIEEEYRVHWIVDNLPVGVQLVSDEQIGEKEAPETFFSRGFPVGLKLLDLDGDLKYALYNHIRIIVEYHEEEEEGGDSGKSTEDKKKKFLESGMDAGVRSLLLSPFRSLREQDQGQESSSSPVGRIVGFRVEPFSINHKVLSSSSSSGNNDNSNGTGGKKKRRKKEKEEEDYNHKFHQVYAEHNIHLESCNAQVQPKDDPANYLYLPFLNGDQGGANSGANSGATNNGGNSASSSSGHHHHRLHAIFSYDVHWEVSDKTWASRWDVYLSASSPQEKIHWFSITNSTSVVLFLTIMVALILVRVLKADISKYNDGSSTSGGLGQSDRTFRPSSSSSTTATTGGTVAEERGWKLVHGDVFRPPSSSVSVFSALCSSPSSSSSLPSFSSPSSSSSSSSSSALSSALLLSVFAGTGSQLLAMLFLTLLFAVFGLLSPANRGSLVTSLILLFVAMGGWNGYISASLYKSMRGTEWKANTVLSATLFPFFVFAIFFVLNLALWSEGSSGAVPFSALFQLVFLWLGVSSPLVFLGSMLGYRREVSPPPVSVNKIPRLVPPQPWYLHPLVSVLFAGVFPFGAVSVELYFIMRALWLHQIYYIFGFLFLTAIILCSTCCEISILLCYFQLSAEDYHWWWRSFLSSGSTGFYLMLYAVWYYFTELDLDGFIPSLLYFGYMTIMCLTVFLATGSIGFFSCYYFLKRIYSSIKVT